MPRSVFCSDKHRYAFRDRRRLAENPERERERSRRYYAANREAVLAKAAAKRGSGVRDRPELVCSECGERLEGRQRVVCSRRRCKDARFRRLHPVAYAAKERLAKLLLELGEEAPASSGVTAAGDERRLRGIPAVSRHSSGAIAGTDPLRALLAKERRWSP